MANVVRPEPVKVAVTYCLVGTYCPKHGKGFRRPDEMTECRQCDGKGEQEPKTLGNSWIRERWS